MRIRAEHSCLVVIDIQENLAPAIHDSARVIGQSKILVQAAGRLGVPVLASEQYPKGLGRTVPELLAIMPPDCVVDKLHFACTADPGWMLHFGGIGRRQAVVCGTEAHVCVLQTAMGLIENGNQVFVVEDASSSRRPENHRLAMERLRAAGAAIVSTEMVLFEWMDRAGTPEFKDVIKLIK